MAAMAKLTVSMRCMEGGVRVDKCPGCPLYNRCHPHKNRTGLINKGDSLLGYSGVTSLILSV